MYLFNASKRPTPPCRLGLSNINVPILERQRWFCTSILQSLSSSPGKDQFLSSKKLFLPYLGSRVIFSDHPGPKMVHTWRGRGYFIFIEIYVKRQSNPRPPQSVQHSTVHSTFSAQQNNFKI